MADASPVLFEDQNTTLDDSGLSRTIDEDTKKTEENIKSQVEDENILADFLRFRNSITETTEELKSRRRCDKNNEQKISTLLAEKHEAQRLLESEKCRAQTRNNEFDAETLYNKRLIEEKVKELENEKNKYSLSFECGANENKLMKEEVRGLQLAKYTLDKQVDGFQRSLQLQVSLKDACIKQIDDLETKSKVLEKKLGDVGAFQKAIEKNVEEALKMNKNLTESNEEYRKLVTDQEAEVKSLHDDLVRVKVKLANKPQDLQKALNDKQCEMRHIQQLISKKEENLNECLEKLKGLEDEKCKFLATMEDGQKALAAQVLSNEESLRNICSLEEELAKTEKSLEDTRMEAGILATSVNELEAATERVRIEFKERETKLSENIKKLETTLGSWQEEYEAAKQEYESRENALKSELELLRVKLNREMREVETQTICEVMDCEMQTDEKTNPSKDSIIIENEVLKSQLQEQEIKLQLAAELENLYKEMKARCQTMEETIIAKDRYIGELDKKLDRFDIMASIPRITIDSENQTDFDTVANESLEPDENLVYEESKLPISCPPDSTKEVVVPRSVEVEDENSSKTDQSAIGSMVNWVVGKLSRKKDDPQFVSSTLDAESSDSKIWDGTALKPSEDSTAETTNPDRAHGEKVAVNAVEKSEQDEAQLRRAAILSKYQNMMSKMDGDDSRGTKPTRSRLLGISSDDMVKRPAFERRIGDVGPAFFRDQKRKMDTEESEKVPDTTSILAGFVNKGALSGAKGAKKVRFTDN